VLVVQAASESVWPPDADLVELEATYTGAARCYFVSEGNWRLMETQLATPLHNARIIRNPFNVRYDAQPAWPDESEGYKLACVGRLDTYSKGHDLLFDVLQRDKWKSRSLTVSLFGKGSNERTLRKLASLKDLSQVRFCGFVSDVEQVWANHHALILPSRREGLPLAAVEAMLCKRMCIVTDVAGNKEVVQDGETGFIAPAPKAELLDETLERAWHRRADWRVMGERAAESIRRLVPPDPIGVFCEELKELL
jgi:glycosyltransferase involved in cell wall biosynthesis